MAELYTFSSSTSLCCDRSLRSSAESKIQWKRCRRDMNHEERQVDVDLLLVERSTLYSSLIPFLQRLWIVALARKSSSWLLGVFAAALAGALSAFADSLPGFIIYCA